MKFDITANELIELIQPLESVINPSHQIPIFRCVNLLSNKNKIIATVDNQEVRCDNFIKKKNDLEFNFCVDFSMFNTAIKALKGFDLKLTLSEKQLLIKHSKGDFKIPLEDASTYPESKLDQLDNSAKINTEQFKSSLKVGTKFLLDSEMEPVSNLSIEIKKKKTIIRATNKVSLYQNDIKGGGDKSNLLISGKTASILNVLLDSNDELTEIKYNKSMAYFKLGRKTVTSIMQQGSFPLEMFDKIMSSFSDSTPLIIKNKSDLAASIKRVSSLSSKEKDPVIRFDLNNGVLNLSSENKAFSSSSKEDINVDFSENKLIGFNSKLISEIISVFDKGSEFFINKNNCFCIKNKKTSGLLAPVILSNE